MIFVNIESPNIKKIEQVLQSALNLLHELICKTVHYQEPARQTGLRQTSLLKSC